MYIFIFSVGRKVFIHYFWITKNVLWPYSATSLLSPFLICTLTKWHPVCDRYTVTSVLTLPLKPEYLLIPVFWDMSLTDRKISFFVPHVWRPSLEDLFIHFSHIVQSVYEKKYYVNILNDHFVHPKAINDWLHVKYSKDWQGKKKACSLWWGPNGHETWCLPSQQWIRAVYRI